MVIWPKGDSSESSMGLPSFSLALLRTSNEPKKFSYMNVFSSFQPRAESAIWGMRMLIDRSIPGGLALRGDSISDSCGFTGLVGALFSSPCSSPSFISDKNLMLNSPASCWSPIAMRLP